MSEPFQPILMPWATPGPYAIQHQQIADWLTQLAATGWGLGTSVYRYKHFQLKSTKAGKILTQATPAESRLLLLAVQDWTRFYGFTGPLHQTRLALKPGKKNDQQIEDLTASERFGRESIERLEAYLLRKKMPLTTPEIEQLLSANIHRDSDGDWTVNTVKSQGLPILLKKIKTPWTPTMRQHATKILSLLRSFNLPECSKMADKWADVIP